MNTTPVSLLVRIRSHPKDAEAWERLVDIYQLWLRAWLLREEVQPADAEDIVQEVLAVLCRELPHFQHNGRTGAFRNWLRGVVENRFREFRRRRREATLGAHLEELADPQSELSRRFDQEHDQNVVNRLLSVVAKDFEARTWQAFRAFVIDGRRAADVAVELGMSEGAVWTAKSRVLKKLRQAAGEILE